MFESTKEESGTKETINIWKLFKAADYDLSKSDPLKHDFFEKLRHNTPMGTSIKRGLNRIFAFEGGMQSGVLVIRLACTGLTIFGAALVLTGNPVLGFIILAAAMALLVAGPKLLSYHYGSKQNNRKFMTTHVDERMKFAENEANNLKKLNAQLQANQKLLEGVKNKSVTVKADAPAPAQEPPKPEDKPDANPRHDDEDRYESLDPPKLGIREPNYVPPSSDSDKDPDSAPDNTGTVSTDNVDKVTVTAPSASYGFIEAVLTTGEKSETKAETQNLAIGIETAKKITDYRNFPFFSSTIARTCHQEAADTEQAVKSNPGATA